MNQATVSIDEDPVNGRHYMAEMGHWGDRKTLWSKDNPDEVEAARREFNFLVSEKKFSAFKVEGKDGLKGEQIFSFDPTMERIMFVPALKGG